MVQHVQECLSLHMLHGIGSDNEWSQGFHRTTNYCTRHKVQSPAPLGLSGLHTACGTLRKPTVSPFSREQKCLGFKKTRGFKKSLIPPGHSVLSYWWGAKPKMLLKNFIWKLQGLEAYDDKIFSSSYAYHRYLTLACAYVLHCVHHTVDIDPYENFEGTLRNSMRVAFLKLDGG